MAPVAGGGESSEPAIYGQEASCESVVIGNVQLGNRFKNGTLRHFHDAEPAAVSNSNSIGWLLKLSKKWRTLSGVLISHSAVIGKKFYNLLYKRKIEFSLSPPISTSLRLS